MQLDGMIPTKCPPDQVVQLLLAPDALRELMPAGCEVGDRQDNSVPFVIRRKVGPIKLSMAGNLTLTPAANGKGYDLEILASHMVAGRIKIAMALLPEGKAGLVQRLSWNGQLEAHGLAARLIEGRGKRIRWFIENMFANLRDQIEWA
jgi:carbon monoxide dehydrogenase subunit G